MKFVYYNALANAPYIRTQKITYYVIVVSGPSDLLDIIMMYTQAQGLQTSEGMGVYIKASLESQGL